MSRFFFGNGGPFGIRIPYISIPLPHTTKMTYILIIVDWLKDVMKYKTSMPWVLCAIGNVLTFCHIFLKETWLSSINIWGQKALRSVFCKLLFPQMKFNNKKKYEHHHLSQSFLWSCWKRKFFGSKSISQLLKYLAPSFLEIRSTQKRMNKIWICFTFQISTLNNQEPVL